MNKITNVIKAPDPRLRIQTKPVKKINHALISILNDMVKLTKTFKEPEGVGLAASQIGLAERFFVARLHESKHNPPSNPTQPRTITVRGQRAKRWTGYGKEFVRVINPKILSYSKRTKAYFEGCLSIPTIWGQVKRHVSIKVEYLDTGGNTITKNLTDIPAWIFQHEMDHLDGILFTERVLEQKGKFYKFKGKDKTGTDIFEEISI